MAKTFKAKAPKQMNVGIRGEVTRYANEETKQIAPKMDGFNYAKVWFIPGKLQDSSLENVAFGSYGGLPDYDNPMMKFWSETKDGISVLKNKFLDHWGNVAQEWKSAMDAEKGNYKRARERIASAAIVNSTDIDATKTINVLARVLGLQTRNYFLSLTVTPIPSPNLLFSADTFTEGSVAGKVSELMEPALIPHTEARANYVLYKNIGHIAISEEARLKGSHNTMALRQDKTMRDLNRLLNSQIGVELETATDVAGADWGAVSGTPPDSTNNPITDIQGVTTTIEGNGFTVDFIAGHDRPVTDLLTNKFIRGRGNVGIGTNVLSTNTPSESGLPAVIKDQALTNTMVQVGSRDATWLGVGPTSVASYNNDVVGYEGWLAKQWFLPVLVQTGAIRTLTGVSA